MAFAMYMDPVAFLQWVQWQINLATGSPVIEYLMLLQRQEPVSVGVSSSGVEAVVAILI